MNIRIYVTLLKHQDSQIEYKKLIVMVDTSLRVSMLKRKVEQEFTELFPMEKPFICSKLEDQYGYSLSNSSLVGELLKNDDRLVAVPEEQGKGFVSSTDTRELISMLNTIQENISGKLSESAVSAYNPIKELLFAVLPLCFVPNPTTMHNACISLSKSIHEGNLSLLEDSQHSDLQSLLITTLNYLITELMEQDTVVQRSILDILEVITKSKKFSNSFKNPQILKKLMNSSKSMNTSAKSKIIKVISNINKADTDTEEFFIDTQPKSNKEHLYSRSKDQYKYGTEDKNKIQYDGYREDRPERLKTVTRDHTAPNKGNTGADSIVTDFILMISPQNTMEMICFALHSLENFIPEAATVAMQDAELFSRCFNLIEITTPNNFHTIQLNFIHHLASRLTQPRAEEVISKNGITRLLKAYTSLPERLQSGILELLEQSLKLGRRVVEIPALISVCLCPYPTISVLGMKTLAVLADPAEPFVSDAQFENHVRFFITACTSDKQGEDYKNAAAACIANLSLREYLRPQIIYCGGVDTFLFMIKETQAVDAQRMAAKALVNLTATKKDLKMKVISELSEEIKKLYRNELDGIVSAYLQTLVSSR
jgi:Cdc14 phosphatase binding protein N-terminus